MNNDNLIINLTTKYNLNENETKELLRIIEPIYIHKEFQKRMHEPFYHHGNISLGEHIIEDSIVTYKMVKKRNIKHNSINLDLAVKIAMFHDLYTEPWQNNITASKKSFTNKHGLRHPIEAIINAYVWYPSIFNNISNSKIIIDGVLHHMFPLPVSSRKSFVNNLYELNNYAYFNTLPKEIKEIIINSLKRRKIGHISFSRSIYKEGRIMSSADKFVSIHQIKGFSNTVALVTGKNKKLNKK